MGPNLRQQPGCAVLARFTDENRAQPKPAADGFFDDSEALNRTLAVGRQFCPGKCLAQFFDQGIVFAFDAPQPRSYICFGQSVSDSQGYAALGLAGALVLS